MTVRPLAMVMCPRSPSRMSWMMSHGACGVAPNVNNVKELLQYVALTVTPDWET